MPEVVSDTSPLQYLHQAGHLDLLRTLYGRVVVPGRVALELDRGRELGIDLSDVRSIPWLEVHTPGQESLLRVIRDLGADEKEALALGLETATSLVILEDERARKYATLMGLPMTGTLGVLLRAKSRGLLTSIRPILDRLVIVGVRVGAATRKAVLELAGEDPS